MKNESELKIYLEEVYGIHTIEELKQAIINDKQLNMFLNCLSS